MSISGEIVSRRFVDPKSQERNLPNVPQGAQKGALKNEQKKQTIRGKSP